MSTFLDGSGLAASPGQLRIAVDIYAVNDRPCLSLVEVESGEVYECFTSNLPYEPLRDDEVVVCTWRLPMSTVRALLETDAFLSVRTLAVGSARGAVWQIRSTELLLTICDRQAQPV